MIDTKLGIAILIGLTSVYCLLTLLRTRLPGFFSRDPANLDKVIRVQAGVKTHEDNEHATSESLLQSIEDVRSSNRKPSRVPLQRKFRYAGWVISPALFYSFEISIALLLFSIAALNFNIVLQIAALCCGPLIMQTLLSRAIARRVREFDKDYAQFLMSVVGLLKTGMTAMMAIQASAKGLDPRSLVRSEVELMVERVRYGIAEDKSIGAFAEDIEHPEIELFIQALLLSRRLGGNLSDTLERLSKQVRKRQYFRSSAEAAIGLQKGSLYIIIVILVGVETYIGLLYPDLVTRALDLEIGWNVWQICFVLIGTGIVWIGRVTKIKV